MKLISDYIQTYDLFSPEYCHKLIDIVERSKWRPHMWYDNSFAETVNEKDFLVTDNQQATQIMKPFIDKALYDYAVSFMGDYCRSLRHSAVRFNKYSIGQSIKEHIDHIHNLFQGEPKGIPILSLVRCLKNDYEDGQFMMCDKPIDIKAGQVIIFPSLFIYPHSVTTVTKGHRYSWVSWAV